MEVETVAKKLCSPACHVNILHGSLMDFKPYLIVCYMPNQMGSPLPMNEKQNI